MGRITGKLSAYWHITATPSTVLARIYASTGTIKFVISPPFWLKADPRGGTVGAEGVTVTLSPKPQASKLPLESTKRQ